MKQVPSVGSKLLKWVGDVLEVRAYREERGAGRMVFRTNLCAAAIHREEVLKQVEAGHALKGDDWHDIPMEPCGKGEWRVRIPLLEVGVFAGKICFLPNSRPQPEWPDGDNMIIKVAPAETAAGNMVYAAFVRQFGVTLSTPTAPKTYQSEEAALDRAGYTVIPPSGTFRALIRHLDHILVRLGFRSLLLLPIHPTPTTFARMGRFGSPFAGRDFLDIDPALAEFDTSATPLDQFHELIRAVHARGATIMMDLPANHTGWAATFQIHHPEWYKRNSDGSFHSPGAWGVTWEDLVELDYSKPELRRAIADVFLYWCRQGVDGFRCDAGYMIPQAAWDVIVALVRREFPDTIFLLEGLGGPMETTETLIGDTGLDWAYSELFQTYTREALERMLPSTIALSEQRGPLMHFAETHDNNRLAATSPAYAKLRIALSAMLSQQGAFGITAGVEWFAKEKIDVHGCGGLNWGAEQNACAWIRRLNVILRTHPLFGPETTLRQVQRGGGNVLAVLRSREGFQPLLILMNLEWNQPQTVSFDGSAFPARKGYDLIAGTSMEMNPEGVPLAPGQVCCVSAQPEDLSLIEGALSQRGIAPILSAARRRRRVMAMRTLAWLGEPRDFAEEPEDLAARFVKDPVAFAAKPSGELRTVQVTLPNDFTREVPVPPGALLYVTAPSPFRATLQTPDGAVCATGVAIAMSDGGYGLMLPCHPERTQTERVTLAVEIYTPEGVRTGKATLWALTADEQAMSAKCTFTGAEVRQLNHARAILTNGTGAMSQIRLNISDIRSQYDCLLAINTHPSVPSDRQVFFTRLRAWILCNGFSTPLGDDNIEKVFVSPDGSFIEWHLLVPCGMGRRVPLKVRAALEPLHNRFVLRVVRERPPEGLRDPAVSVGLVLRPDIEWRNFHCKTKAFMGPETTFPGITHHRADGFDFTADPNHPMAITLVGGEWNHEEAWTYCVKHPEEAARGQEGESDLWSPGWFHIELDRGDEAVLVAGEPIVGIPRVIALGAPLPPDRMSITEMMTHALKNYIVRRDAHKTVIAGYPWFLDWGRDSLIFLRGVIAADDWETTVDLLREFARFEKQGTIPNMIRGEDDANRETVDAPLWLAVTVDDAIAKVGSKKILDLNCGKGRTLKDVLISIAENYIKGTVNGIKADPETGLIWAPAHYTWMDTNYPAGTPRNGYAVEIQALWVRLLDLLGREVAPKWKRLASKVRRAFRECFPLPQGGLADCLYAEQGVGPRAATQDDAVRPNQLYAITLGLLKNDKDLAASVLSETACLLTPGAIRTLADRPTRFALRIVRDGKLLNDPHNPYWGRYEGDEDTRRKPAYHNGTGWTFPFPLYAEALVMTYGPGALTSAKALLGSGRILLNQDCVTQLPECTQGNAPHEPCGTGAQAWGASEYLRVLKRLEHLESTGTLE